MPIYSIQGPDGKIYEIEGPEGATKAQVVAAIQAKMQASAPAPAPVPMPVVEPAKKEGFGAALGKGIEGILSPSRTAIGALTGSAEEAALAGLKRSEASPYADQVSLDKVKQAYQRGLLPAAGEVLRQIPLAITEQAPNIAATLGSARLGAMAGAGLGSVVPGLGTAVGTIGGGILGAVAPSLLQQFGGNIQRQAQEQLAAKQPVDISRTAAAAAALPQAGLDVAATFIPLGRTVAGSVLGPQVKQLLERGAQEGAEKLARESLPKVLAKGAGISVATEAPTEVVQSMLERAQAGLPLLSEDALNEYGEAAYQASLIAPIGSAARVGERSTARQQTLPPELRPGETDRQAAERIQAEILEMKRAAQPPAPGPILDTNNLYTLMAQPNGYGLVEQYKQRLLALPKQTPEIKEAIEAASFIQNRSVIEKEQRRTTKPAPEELVPPKGPDAGEAVTPPSGEGVQVAGEPSAETTAQGLGGAKPSGVVPPVEDAGQPPRGEAPAPAAVAPKVEALQGSETRLILPDGQKRPAKWEVIEADSVSAAMFEGRAQPRDRQRAASNAQVLAIANNPDFDRLSDTSQTMDYGAPTLTGEYVIVGGNGRFEGVNLSYDTEAGQAYKQNLISNAQRFGLDPAQVSGMKKPVLIRKIPGESAKPDETRKLAIQSNIVAGLEMSDMERAALDSERMTNLQELDITDTGDIPLTTKNMGTIRDALKGYTKEELSGMLAADGSLSQSGLRRVKNAVLYKAYGKTDTLARLLESPDADLKNVGTALMRASGSMSRLMDGIRSGAIPSDYDIIADLTGAVETLSALRASGTKVQDFISQSDMFGGGISNEAKTILTFLDQNLRSAKSITEFLNDYASAAISAESAGDGLFGEVELPSKQETIERAAQRPEAERAAAKTQQTIFEQPAGATATEGAAKPEGEGRPLEGGEGAVAKKSLVEMRKRYEAGRAAVPAVETPPEKTELDKEIEAKIEELGRVLSRIMGKFGLKDVALKLVEDMKAEGEYAQSVVRLALDAASPVQALRHESIHALKELGFFSPQQWAVLEKQAKSKWIDQYLKNVNVNKEPLGEGEKSRYDAYNTLYAQQGQQQGLQGDALQEFIDTAVIEEAIADAFGDFDVNKAPPGMMQAILNRLRNFFDAVKTAFGGEVTAEQVFRKVEKGELKAEAAPATEGEAKPSLRAPKTEAFKRWFGDSKVVDENGEPLVVYHGTNKTDTLADEPKQAIGQFDAYVNWFTTDPYQASGYATQDGRQIEGAATYPAYLSLQKPMRLRGDLNDRTTYAQFRKETGLNVQPGPYEDEVIDGIEQNIPKWWITNSPSFADAALEAGFDGVIADEGGTKTFGVFYQNPGKIKSATGNIGTFDKTKPDIRYSLREVPLSTRGLMEVQPIVAMQELGLKTDAVRKPGGIELFNDVRSIALALNQDTIRNRGKIAKTDTSLTSEKELARAMVDEIGYQLRATADTGTGKGWYSDNYPKAVKKLGKLFPELETDPYARTVFSALVAITSNGEKVSLNVKNAIKLYEDIRMGKDPRDIGSRRQKALDNNIAVVLQLMKQYGPTGMRNELLREITVKDMNAILRSRGEKADTSYLADTKVPAAALYFGPKLGAFFSNLEGAEGYLTMDMWWTRTVNRMRGQLESKATEASIKKFADMMEKPNATREEVVAATIPLRNKYEEFGWHTELEELVGSKEPAEDKDKPAWTAKAKRKAGPAYQALLFEHRLEKMANTIYKNEYELLEEAPFTSTDREFMYRTARRAQSLLKAEGINLSLADIQAALWYYEKRLYQHLSGRKADDIGYDEAITQLARESTGPARSSVVFGGQPVSGAGPAGAGTAATGVGSQPAKLSLRSTIPTATRQRIVQTTVTRDEKTFYQRIIEAISPSSFQSFRADALNRYDRLGVYDKKLAEKMGGKALLASSSAEAAALLSDLGAGLTASALGVHDRMGGIPVYRNGITIISNMNGTVKGPTAIFAPLAREPGDYQAYQYWAAVKRGMRLLYTVDPKTGESVERLITEADGPIAEALRKQYLKDFKIDFNAIQEDWIKYNDGLVDYMLATGVLSKERASVYKQYADYLPFYRQMNGEETVGPKIFQSIAGIKPPKKIKGGEALIDDFLENIVRNTQSAIQAGVKNIASKAAADVATKIQMAIRLDYQASSPDVFHVYEDGKPVSYRSKDQLFINAIKSLGLPDLPFIGFLSGPANLLRNLVTKDPGFMLANLMRDSMSAWVTSGVKMTPMVDTISNFGSAIAGKSPEFQALMNAGILGGYEFSQNVEQSGREFGKALRKQTKVKQPGMKGVLEMGAKPFTSLWDALEKGSTASDAATRIEIYKKTLAETGNEAEALYRALEVMNFNRKGSSAVVRILTAAVPFLNARMQGLDVLYRASTGNMNAVNAKQIQKNFFVRGAMIAALSTAYWALTHDDEEYKKQEQETRDNYWLLPSLGVKIPIPFEIGVLFKVIPERILGYTMGSDTGEDFLKSMARQLTSTLAFNPIPQTVLPVVESMTNYSFFTMRPIVGQGLEGLQPAYQVAPGTTRIAEAIGSATKGLPKELQISPAKMDQLISGYTGTMGMYMVNLMDAIFDMNTDSPKPSRRFEQLPLIRRFALDPEARGAVTGYYELKNSVDSIVRTSNMLERTMNYEELPGYLQDNARMLATKDYLLDLEKTMKEFREMKIMIRSAKMSADAKGDAIASIEKMENQLTANIQYLKRLAKGG